MMVRRDATGLRLLTRNGYDWTRRFPTICKAVDALKARSCLIDGEAVYCGDDGIAEFQKLRRRSNDRMVFLYAFDLIELNGEDMRRRSLMERKGALAKLIANAAPGLTFNEHIEGDGRDIFLHAMAMGLEGIVSKFKAAPYRSGRSREWLKLKNPKHPAVTRLAEEDWNQ
jgi:ATP-dependent DNA ligase